MKWLRLLALLVPKNYNNRFNTNDFKKQKGEVLIDGIPSEEINLSSWRKQVGYVTQDGVIFNGTVLENIGGIDCNASDEEIFKKVKSAAKQANILSFIEDLPQGFETNVGEGD